MFVLLPRVARRCLLIALALCQVGCGVGYLSVQGVYQLKLLAGREPIPKVLEDESLSEETRAKLKLILDIQAFADDVMGMGPSGTYTTANLGFDHTIYNVSACQPLAFEPHSWWFPIVGSIPYKGFFRTPSAQRQADKLRAKGLDVVMREVGAYSTLGYFNDPVLPGMLEYSRLGLVDLILHELAHGVLYFKGEVDFNESFASFVGKWGAYAYLDAQRGGALPTREEAVRRYADQDRHHAFMRQLYASLDSIYQSPSTDSQKRSAKEAALAQARLDYAQLPFESEAYQGRTLGILNNAHLMSFQRYHSGESSFHDLFAALDGNWPLFFEVVSDLEGEESPFEALKNAARYAAQAPVTAP